MEEHRRAHPLYSMCGLNCGLCPNFHSDKAFQCPGCGGEGFRKAHPSCAIFNCGQKRQVAFCTECDEYPCKRYDWMAREPIYDSFITYRHVVKDRELVKAIGLPAYYALLEQKVDILRFLLKNYNSGRQKTILCLAVNLLALDALQAAMEEIIRRTASQQSAVEKSKTAVAVLTQAAARVGIVLKLNRKK